MVKANKEYLGKLADRLSGKNVEPQDYKLARKAVYVSSANLSAAFQRMTSEPKSRQKNTKAVHQFVVLNHILSSYTATVVSAVEAGEQNVFSGKNLQTVNAALKALGESFTQLQTDAQKGNDKDNVTGAGTTELNNADEPNQLLTEQLNYIRKVCEDIFKVTESFLASPSPKFQGEKKLREGSIK